MNGLKSLKIRHWLMSALRGKADISVRSAIGQKRALKPLKLLWQKPRNTAS